MRQTLLRVGLASSLALGALISSAASAPALAADPPPSLAGERFLATISTIQSTIECDEWGETGTATLQIEGTAEGPYPGTFTETVTVEFGPLQLSTQIFPQMWLGRMTRFDATFTIDSPQGDVTGTKEIWQTYGNVACTESANAGPDFGLISFFNGAAEVLEYEASIDTTAGRFTDSGFADAFFQLRRGGNLPEDGIFIENFTVSSGVLPEIGPPANVSVTPVAATNVVGEEHCVTATATDSSGTPTEDVTIYFTVAGTTTERDTSSGSAATDADGEAEFCYTAQFPGSDTITAVADADDDGSPELGEPTNTASKTYVLPTSTALCQVTVSDGGWIIAANGDRATFGGTAKVTKDGQTRGEQVYQDHGPAQTFTARSTNVLAVVCGGSEATIYGRATVDGAGQYFYRIEVSDLSKNGKTDRYGILLSNGYYSGDMVLRGGNIVIKL